MAKKRARELRKTLLIMGEGAIDYAFLTHLKSIFDHRQTNQRVKIDSADGGSPRDILNCTIRRYQHQPHDVTYILLDQDVPVADTFTKKAKKQKIQFIVSEPICIEGMLLTVLNQPTSSLSNQQCKDKLHRQLTGDPTEAKSYASLFTETILRQSKIHQIQLLIKLLENKAENIG